MQRLTFTPKEHALLEAAFKAGGSVAVKGRDARHARRLCARGYGGVEGRYLTLTEAGRAAWLAVRDGGAAAPRTRVSTQPETWGPPPPEAVKRRRGPAPLARLYSEGTIDDSMLNAGRQIIRGFHVVTAGTGYRSVRYDERVDCEAGSWGESVNDFNARISRRYALFREIVAEERLNLDALIDMLIYDTSFKATDRRHRRGAGWSRWQLIAALSGFVSAMDKSARRRSSPVRNLKHPGLGDDLPVAADV